ncbi:chemotaxis protein [bacterium M00.F.Ca.ET.228.01.1.1]|uniref:methyl-accepting chemotaxis protein n=1 Tax=Paraburkholderia phenoliruptrix TaxID=252970 RepID=UPI001092F927|nr:methyl-accepting chemotaxis protein [Paraburkholderia phenoliruptrix]TGP46412.1 chemotaxis protein [bacterium M00.F.Ca.ET.228.01.1.1]TGS03674.1 chemotaxis protein [bacterium M00.F.Ca.ET.191.01.1.1]TGU07706.1 chemotaxis protein [bacterium M00.F.Ca.ET.155.01.1.1]MBW0446166.1 conjugal transfer protein TraG [Paraburkholderia phenoliruptrix]MBW9096589.1 conjugal transfer protein TraG [Paraburkholderia phenoliruptrix]
MADANEIVDLTREVHRIAKGNVSDINDINRETTFLAINALIESARAGDAGRGFAVVANQVKVVSQRIGQLTTELGRELTALGDRMITQLEQQEAQRLTDLALNMIEIIDRNLYERSCDVRWWATDSAIVDCLAHDTPEHRAFASERLGVILDSYTVYLDLWVIDMAGNVVATGRPGQFAAAGQENVADKPWFKAAARSASGAEYAAAELESVTALGGAAVATYAAAIREGGANRGRPLGVLAVFFNWAPQASTVVKGVRLSAEEWTRTRCLLVDARKRVIASSDDKGMLQEVLPLAVGDPKAGAYRPDADTLVAYALTPGYETYEGMGWYGVIVRKRAGR